MMENKSTVLLFALKGHRLPVSLPSIHALLFSGLGHEVEPSPVYGNVRRRDTENRGRRQKTTFFKMLLWLKGFFFLHKKGLMEKAVFHYDLCKSMAVLYTDSLFSETWATSSVD